MHFAIVKEHIPGVFLEKRQMMSDFKDNVKLFEITSAHKNGGAFCLSLIFGMHLL